MINRSKTPIPIKIYESLYNLAYSLAIDFDPKENQIPCRNNDTFEMIKNTRPTIESAKGRMSIGIRKWLGPIMATSRPMTIIAVRGSKSIHRIFPALFPLVISNDMLPSIPLLICDPSPHFSAHALNARFQEEVHSVSRQLRLLHAGFNPCTYFSARVSWSRSQWLPKETNKKGRAMWEPCLHLLRIE